jgi:hypothetical protein
MAFVIYSITDFYAHYGDLVMNTKYDDLYDSIVNGQFKQFVRQFDGLDSVEKSDWLNYVAYELDQSDLVIRAMQAYFSIKAR